MKPRLAGFGLVPLLYCFCASAALNPTAADSEGLRAAAERYRVCAALSLPDNFSKVGNPRHAADKALTLCQKKRLALAGQYALDNPGTRSTGEYVDGVTERVARDLAGWITDMKSLGVQGPR
ncbi:hypothetical protein GT347_01955 [Xylophilus rhododendri]|uniref:Secreted protein n=1 Tax=Xylophilus rhododendri TaxID=2697032 RepID=A0A857J194_9BURK|nr:hypothetical protein [Xylophilus rhododendri]QHI96862.1 hypothetical protein GT347_01955 [Xylophilus rhododendri]